MGFFGRPSIVVEAERDAELDLEAVDDRITARLGLRPIFNAVGDHRHGLVAAGLRSPLAEEWRDDLRDAEREFARHAAPGALGLGIVATLAVECLGGVLIMRALDVPASERLFLGVALAFAIIGLTAVTAGNGGESLPSGAPARRRLVSIGILAAYTLLVGSIALVRLRSAPDDDLTTSERLAETVVLVATALGPPFLCESMVRRRRPALLLARRIGLLKRDLKRADRERGKAEAIVGDLAKRSEAFDREAARLRAEYTAAHRRTRAALTGSSSSPTTPSTSRRKP